MAKRIVITKDGDEIPFLRGVLIESLITAGLDFEESFKLAQKIRDGLDDEFEITTSELSKLTAKALEKSHGKEAKQKYEQCPFELVDSILVQTRRRDLPFSKGTLAFKLESYGIDPDKSAQAARLVYEQLSENNLTEITHTDLNKLTYKCLRDNFSQKIANKFISWREFDNSGKSLVLMIGGVTGVGKSTVSHEICNKLDIPQIQSTDMIRQIIRSYLAPPLVPLLQYSSFEAWKAIPNVKTSGGVFNKSPPVIEGYLSQKAILNPALQAAFERAEHEHEHLVIEGVHTLPLEIDLSDMEKDVIAVPVMLANTNKKSLKKQLSGRGKEQEKRPASRYIKNLDHIWVLQTYLLKTADKANIKIIHNQSISNTTSSIVNLVANRMHKEFPPEKYREKWDNDSSI